MAKLKPAKAVIPTLKFSTMEIDNKEYRLAYDYNAIALAEVEARCNLLIGLESLTNLNALQLRGLLYAALTPFMPGITIEQAGDLIRIDTITPITEAMAKAYQLSLERSKSPTPAAPIPEEADAAEGERQTL